ncbi:MAG: hypothetical protein QOD77_438 [Thermoplasmata archaeon]|jgi:DNA-binding MarR family transcriptional regulator|nr:hypothetical protein [Thermoplasmata archaeon]
MRVLVALLASLLAVAAAVSAGGTSPDQIVDGAHTVVVTVANDPNAAVQDPGQAANPLLFPQEPEEEAPPVTDPGKGDDGGWADQVRAAFRDDSAMASLVTLSVAGLGVTAFGLVTRYISPKEALKNPQRAMLYGFIKGNPGVHLKKLSEEFAMKTSSILWHIRKLESAELVHSERANGYRVFYPTEGGIEVKKVSRATAALQNDNARQLFERIALQSGQSASKLAHELGLHVGTARWHLRKLVEFGLVEELPIDGGAYIATPLGRRAVDSMKGLVAPTAPQPAAVAA